MSSLKPFSQGFTPVIGLALVGSGAYGILKPLNMAHIFGILNAGKPEVLFYPGLAGRNLAAGIAVLSLSYQEQYKPLGTFLLSWMVVGFVDTWICLTNPKVVNTWIHIMNTYILAIVAPGLLDWW